MSGGHGEGGRQGHGGEHESWARDGHVKAVPLKEAVHCCWVGSSSTNSPGTAPSPCPETPGAGTGHMYCAACS